MRRLHALGLSLSVPALASGALADPRPWAVQAGMGAVVSDGGAGPAFNAELRYTLGTFLDVAAHVEFCLPRAGGLGSRQVGVGGTGIYNIDVFEWLPYAGVGVGYAWFRQNDTGLGLSEPTLLVPFGLDYRFDEALTAGVQGQFHWLWFSPDPPIVDATLWTLTARAGYRF